MTRWWWIRHAPVTGHDGRIYGNLDVDCDCGDEPLFRALAGSLPADAVWIVTPLSRTRATAAAVARHLPDGPAVFHLRSDTRPGGKGGVSQWTRRGSPDHYNTKTHPITP